MLVGVDVPHLGATEHTAVLVQCWCKPCSSKQQGQAPHSSSKPEHPDSRAGKAFGFASAGKSALLELYSLCSGRLHQGPVWRQLQATNTSG